ncbi:hypothetical protein ACFV0H_01760 [Streptomyces erythrochromogenes]|uniref:Uncharacterized protein n=1 Tax=Streptomyces erythrochromogenes TaxID=285574 RepID=A0ABZ1Q6F8_9ACTN|nr:hypothetical protein [Streptomyces erythrochromogenes]MCX5583231.1 hypothetical protein [Streptomyces erythrochromogenes]
MLLDVQGKKACWRTLETLAHTDERLSTEHLDALAERAEKQLVLLEELRIAAVTQALCPQPSSTR